MTRRDVDPQIVTRARGAMLGLAAGNQLAVPTERYATPQAIRVAFPNGVWDLAPPPERSPYDDDTALTVLLAESLVDRGTFDVGDVSRRWVDWMKRDGRGLGAVTTHALRLIDRGVEPFEAGRLVREADPLTSAGNGAVMRCLPVAIRYHDSFDRLIRASTQQAAVSHSDERCLWGAVAVNLAVSELLHGNAYFVDEVLHHLDGRAPRALLTGIRRALREDQAELPITIEGQTGYVVHCVEIAFWFATHGRTLEDALVYLAQAGGDTGTNAAVTGALLGARDGEIAIPQRWMDQLVEPRRLTRLAELLVEAAPDPTAPEPG